MIDFSTDEKLFLWLSMYRACALMTTRQTSLKKMNLGYAQTLAMTFLLDSCDPMTVSCILFQPQFIVQKRPTFVLD